MPLLPNVTACCSLPTVQVTIACKTQKLFQSSPRLLAPVPGEEAKTRKVWKCSQDELADEEAIREVLAKVILYQTSSRRRLYFEAKKPEENGWIFHVSSSPPCHFCQVLSNLYMYVPFRIFLDFNTCRLVVQVEIQFVSTSSLQHSQSWAFKSSQNKVRPHIIEKRMT